MLDDASRALAQQGAPAASLAPADDRGGAGNRADTFANAADRAAARGD
jgi:hypothetical protein